jgi:hypothetical protein
VGRDPVLWQHLSSSVIVDDRDLVRVSALPTEADAPLVVHTDAVLPLTVSLSTPPTGYLAVPSGREVPGPR